MRQTKSENAKKIWEAVKATPGLTRHALMLKVRPLGHNLNKYWYRDCAKAIRDGLVTEDNSGRYPTLHTNTEAVELI